MKIKVKKTVETEEEIDIEFPAYTKKGSFYYKIIDDHKAIMVSNYSELSYGIYFLNTLMAIESEFEFVHADEFNSNFEIVKSRINEL